MTPWFTVDLHRGNTDFIKHCRRPFVTTGLMDRALIDNGIFDYLTALRGTKRLLAGKHDDEHVVTAPEWASVQRFLNGREGSDLVKVRHYVQQVWRGS